MANYDREAVFGRALNECGEHKTLASLARALGVSRTTLSGIVAALVDPAFAGDDSLSMLDKLKAHAATVDLDAEAGALREQLRYAEARIRALEKAVHKRAALLDEFAAIAASCANEPVRFPKRPEQTEQKSEHIPMLLVSDIHYGSTEEGLGIFPVYNPDIAEKVVYAIFERAMNHLDKWGSFMSYPLIIVNLVGDLVDGNYLRKGHRRISRMPVTKQVVNMGRILDANIRALAQMAPKVLVLGEPGNHGRVDPQWGAAAPFDNWDWMLYKFLEASLANQPNVEVFAPECWYTICKIYSWTVMSLHGEDVRSWAGIPWYGITRAIKNLQAMTELETKQTLRQLDQEFELENVEQLLSIMSLLDTVIFGHFHVPISWDEVGVDAVTNGAAVGVTEYTAKRLKKMTRPSQKLLAWHKEWGLVNAINIRLDDIIRVETKALAPQRPVVIVP